MKNTLTNKIDKKKHGDLQNEQFFIIGIGASAGGLEALKLFFDHVPSDCKHSFVIVQHLSPDYKSLMVELLAKNTSLPIFEVKNNMVVAPGSIYLIPARKNMKFKNGRLSLTDKPQSHHLNLPIDIFFHSLAEELKERSIAIILSGTGTDGSRGVHAVKEMGGMVMVQSPATAKFDGMPNSAIAIGVVDYIVPVAQMPKELLDYIATPHSIDTDESVKMLSDEYSLSKILSRIKEHTNLDFYGYKRPTLIRRIARRMYATQHKNLKEYYNYIKENDAEVQLLYREFLIGVTKFFRDNDAFQILENKVLPELVAKKKTDQEFKVWCIGCSTGEEVYSIAILLDEILERKGKKLNVRIFGTDIEPDNLEKASKAIYSGNITKDVSFDRLQKYFIKKGNQYYVNQKIRNKAIFSCHDVLKDPTINKLDLVICRNMLIYINTEMQQKVLSKIHYALNKDSILFLGSSETIGDAGNLFNTIDKKWKLYRTKEIPFRSARDFTRYSDIHKHGLLERSAFKVVARKKPLENNLSEILNETLLDQFGVAGIYIDEHYHIMHAVGDFKKYIEIPDDQFSLNLLKMLPENLFIPTSTAIRKVIKQNEKVIYEGVKWRTKNTIRTINILVNPFELNTTRLNCFLVVFIEEKVEKETATIIKNTLDNPKTAKLLVAIEEELKLTKESLQTTIEEVETSNEELQTTNEELLSSNEELQSTNEELQSVNEELHTVNAEYQNKIGELLKLNNDIENLIQSTHIPTIFLDSDLNIRKFTPNITEQFNLLDTDIGRPISHFTSKFGEEDSSNFLQIIDRVLGSNKPEQKEIQISEGKWYLQRIFPFIDHSSHNNSGGVVITFVDINAIKIGQEKMRLKTQELESSNDKLSRFNKAAVGREERMIELKKIINEQCEQLNREPLFDLNFTKNEL